MPAPISRVDPNLQRVWNNLPHPAGQLSRNVPEIDGTELTGVQHKYRETMLFSPVMRHINDTPEAWASMWQEQVELGCVPYYMFVARDTGAQDYFAIELERAWRISRNAYQRVSGLARTVREPSMSAGSGKVQILGVTEVAGVAAVICWRLSRPCANGLGSNKKNRLLPARGNSPFTYISTSFVSLLCLAGPELVGVALLYRVICNVLKVEFELLAVKDVEKLIPFQIFLPGIALFGETE